MSFGTAGLRAPMGAGFSRMNSLTVIQTSQGLAQYLLDNVRECVNMGVVIGYDGRHHSKTFADLVVTVFATKGFNTSFYEGPVHTPMVPWGMQIYARHAAAGIMITASHNPAEDNGYKVYGVYGQDWPERAACQINSPEDTKIAASILENLEPITWAQTGPSSASPVHQHVREDYYDRIVWVLRKLRKWRAKTSGDKHLPRFVYTPLHGVGLRPMKEALERFIASNSGEPANDHDEYMEIVGDAGDIKRVRIDKANGARSGFDYYKDPDSDSSDDGSTVTDVQEPPVGIDSQLINDVMTVVQAQAYPDPDFPTIKYPNPEEKGALDLAVATADAHGIGLILANDPDADRFAAAEKVGDAWHQFTGDQVGVLLACYIYQNRKPDHKDRHPVFLTSMVSSDMLRVIGEKIWRASIESATPRQPPKSFYVVECLTGFKWIGKRAEDFAAKCLFGYEEALGYMLPWIVYDKDGISAALLFLQMCAQWGSPWLMLQNLYEKYGFFETMNTYWRSPDQAATTRVFEKIRSLAEPYPKYVGGREVVRWRDLTIGYDSDTREDVRKLPVTPDTQCITCWLGKSPLDEGIRFTIRASGTEPKIKGEGPSPAYISRILHILLQMLIEI